ncbi:acyl-CoA carboxylase epsilon subunit-like protein [Rhodococcus wratislaviensis]|uniref:Acyl-CoA carboxylase epsilon subunit-like protein n=1 Tax=Rhodococcus wratislaviensis TaxID=44752 RepID=A0AB38FJX5_RHOWR|nr:acyl-CoA carboxylase subunit epsilon [Rhodococcus wratislaviensis]REE74808.1 acyl-CoA carboxylase epsilon subunit-like protein [Rhodococcus wratislaviensis]SPZ41650.1 Uncharacterised protein [Rhodococcus wratislaviensis]
MSGGESFSTLTAELSVDEVLDEIALGAGLAEETPAAPAVTFTGNPSDTDIAAVLAVFAAIASSGSAAEAPASDNDSWGTPALILRRQVAAAAVLVNAGY